MVKSHLAAPFAFFFAPVRAVFLAIRHPQKLVSILREESGFELGLFCFFWTIYLSITPFKTAMLSSSIPSNSFSINDGLSYTFSLEIIIGLLFIAAIFMISIPAWIFIRDREERTTHLSLFMVIAFVGEFPIRLAKKFSVEQQQIYEAKNEAALFFEVFNANRPGAVAMSSGFIVFLLLFVVSLRGSFLITSGLRSWLFVISSTLLVMIVWPFIMFIGITVGASMIDALMEIAEIILANSKTLWPYLMEKFSLAT